MRASYEKGLGDMFKRILIPALVAFALLVAASVPAGAMRGERPEVPMKGFITSVESSFDPAAATDDRCPTIGGDVADVVSSFSGFGKATHLGKFTWESSHCTSFGGGFYGDGFMTIVAANGDILQGVYGDGLVLGGPPVAPIVDQVTFVDGGTGRFAHASGGVSEVGTVDFTTFQIALKWSGTIAYGR